MNCNHCHTPLSPDNVVYADGCRCNSPRGVNHGLVHPWVCTCTECDPEQTGSSRMRHVRDVMSVAKEQREAGRVEGMNLAHRGDGHRTARATRVSDGSHAQLGRAFTRA